MKECAGDGHVTGSKDEHHSIEVPEVELRQLLERIEEEPISNELRLLAKRLEDALKARGHDRRPG